MSHNDPIVDLEYIRYRGRRTKQNVLLFLGLPYAEPPIGPRRFRRPVPLDTNRIRNESNGMIKNAREYCDFAVQGCISDHGDMGGAGTEDCLKLDIYANGVASPDNQLPVLVYIHGGGYKFGAPKSWPFTHWVSEHPVVIVSIYYRLSVLGFLSHPKFIATGEADLNAGIWDQIEAMRWIRNNISAFGGNSDEITIMGQSAGAASVQLHLLAYEGREKVPFKGAIIQSLYRTPVFQPQEKVEAYEALIKYLQCEEGGDLKAQLSRLREMSAIEITQAADAVGIGRNPILYAWKPVIDGILITDYPVRLMEQGKFSDVPIIVGATTDEALISSDAYSYFQALNSQFPGLTKEDVEQVKRIYGNDDSLKGARDAIGEGLNRSSTCILGRYFSRAYAYRYNYPAGRDELVHHSADNWMLFEGAVTGPNGSVVFQPLTPEQHAFSRQIMAYLVSFVRTGDPNTYRPEGAPAWPLYDQLESQRIVLGEKTAVDKVQNEGICIIEGVSEDEKQRGEFWIQNVNKTQN